MLQIFFENQMAFAVCRGNRPDRLARVSVSQIAGGDILGDHAACTDDDIVADTHPVYDDGIAGNPDVIPDVDSGWLVARMETFGPIATLSPI